MNRAERRKNKDFTPVAFPYVDRKNAEREKVVSDAVDTAFILTLAIPVMVLHDHYPELMRKEVNGKTREERFTDLCLDLYDTVAKDYVGLEELKETLYKEAGIRIEKR